MHLRIMIGVAAILAIWVVWSFALASDLSPELEAIRQDGINGNIEGLAEKAETYPPKLAKTAIRTMAPQGAKALPTLGSILLKNEKVELRAEAALTIAKAIKKATPAQRPLAKEMTKVLITALKEEKEAQVKVAIATAIGNLRDYNNMESVLDLMGDDDPDVRRRAHVAATKIFGRKYEFNPKGTPAERKAAISGIRQAWAESRGHVGPYHDAYRGKE
jgi:hypothetical protein